MGHGDRASGLDLLLEQRDHRAVAAQYVAKPHRHKAGLALLVHGLDDELTQPLGGPHDIGGVPRFVGADHDELPAAVTAGGQGGLVGAEDVVLDGLAGACLHQGHMLVGRSMVDNVRVIGGEHLLQFALIPDGADQGD